MIDDCIKRLAHKVWEIFEREEIQNNAEGNYQAAQGIIQRIINGSYKIDEFRNLLNAEDYEFLKSANASYVAEDARLNPCSDNG